MRLHRSSTGRFASAVRLLRSRRGGVTPLTVLCLSLLVGMVALAVDGGTLMEERRHVQAAADAAAMAAAADLYSNYPTNKGTDPSPHPAWNSAINNAAANGFTNGDGQSTVLVNISPNNYQGGPNAGKPLPAGYVEVIITYNAGRTFSNIFGTGAVPIRARAVARGVGASNGYDLLLLNLRATPSLIINGTGNLKVNGTVYVNSSSSSAVQLNGGGTLLGAVIDLVGAVGGLLGSLLGLLGLGGSSTSPTTVQPIPDPLRYLSAPDPTTLSTSSCGSNLVVKRSTDLYPGIYPGGITIKGGTVTFHTNADGTPGIYYLQGGGLNVLNSASITTASGESGGVMFYNDWQSATDVVNISTSGSVSLLPPASGPYRGIVLFQERGTLLTCKAGSVPALTVNANGTTSIGGAIYAAYASVNLSSQNSSNILAGQIVADTLTVNGSFTVNLDPNNLPIPSGRSIGLVE